MVASAVVPKVSRKTVTIDRSTIVEIMRVLAGAAVALQSMHINMASTHQQLSSLLTLADSRTRTPKAKRRK